MKIITINLNGVRSAARKGFYEWLRKQEADIICMQELKAQEVHMQDPAFAMQGYHSYFHFAEKKGYSGVGIYTRYEPKKIVQGLGWPSADQEGRYVAIDLGKLWVASLYMPSGTMGPARQTVKFDFLERLGNYLKSLDKNATDFIICGDFNIAHKNIDIKNWKGNQKNTGFLPEERAWLDQLFGEIGFIDAFRVVNQEEDQYTWWSNRGRAREKNVGWRIDYQIITPGIKTAVKSVNIYKDQWFSDHAPLTIEYDILIS